MYKTLNKILLITLISIISANALPHSGDTSRDGCHYDKSAKERHCHNERTQESWDNQMRGYSESRGVGICGWIIIGGIAWFIYHIASQSNHRRNNNRHTKAQKETSDDEQQYIYQESNYATDSKDNDLHVSLLPTKDSIIEPTTTNLSLMVFQSSIAQTAQI